MTTSCLTTSVERPNARVTLMSTAHVSALQRVAVCCNIFQHVSLCFSVLQRVGRPSARVTHIITAHLSGLQRCKVLLCAAVCCSVLHAYERIASRIRVCPVTVERMKESYQTDR